MNTVISSHWPDTDEDGGEYFSIPCPHPDATDGVFKAAPQGFSFTGGMLESNEHSGDRTYLMADVRKLIAKVEDTDPKMMAHARYTFSGESASSWLSNNSKFPYDTGSFFFDTRSRSQEYYDFHYNSIKGSVNRFCTEVGLSGIFNEPDDAYQDKLTLSGGNAGMLILFQELGIDRIPIGVTSDNAQDMEKIVSELGYGEFPIIRAQDKFRGYNLQELQEENAP